MSIISYIIFLVAVLFIFLNSKRVLQILYWNAIIFGFKETLKDSTALIKLHLTVGTFINNLCRQHGSTTLDFYHDGAGVLYEKNDSMTSISVTRYAVNQDGNLREALDNICMQMTGDRSWLKLAKSNPASMLTICDENDHRVFSTVPIIIAFNQIKKHKPTHISGNTIKDNDNALGINRRTYIDFNLDSRHIHVVDGTRRNIFQ